MAGKLTDVVIQAARIPDGKKMAVLTDGAGLRLRVLQDRKEWQCRRRNGSDLRLGLYPQMTLEAARQKAQEARQEAKAAPASTSVPVPAAIAAPAAPTAAPAQVNGKAAPTFGAVAAAWFEAQSTLKPTTKRLHKLRLGYLAPLDPHPVDAIDDVDHIRPVLKAVQAANGGETALRCASLISSVLTYAKRDMRVKFTPPEDLAGMVDTFERSHRKAVLDPVRLGELLTDINLWQSKFGPTVSNCTRLQAHTFVRTGEIIAARWGEFEIDNGRSVWRIPAERMKMARAMKRAKLTHHAVPLSRQAVQILKEQKGDATPGADAYVFPHFSEPGKHVSPAALLHFLHVQLGYKDHVPHGWRAAFESMALEDGQDYVLVEMSLAHKVKTIPYGAAYLRSDLLERRRAVMQWWSDKLDALERVVPSGTGTAAALTA